MSALVLKLPEALQAEVSGQATRRGLSEAAWLEEAVREKLVAETELAYLVGRAARGDRAEYEAMLARVPATAPEPGDER